MIYHFRALIIPFVAGIDLFLMILLYLSFKPKRKTTQRAIYIIALLGFVSFLLFKWMFSDPGSVASTPATVQLNNDKPLTTVYYLAKGEGPPEVFWKDLLIGKQAIRSFEMESDVRYGLVIAKNIDGEMRYQTVQLNDSIAMVNLGKKFFKIDNNKSVESAIARYRWTEFGNYLSHLLTIAFVIILFWRIKTYGP